MWGYIMRFMINILSWQGRVTWYRMSRRLCSSSWSSIVYCAKARFWQELKYCHKSWVHSWCTSPHTRGKDDIQTCHQVVWWWIFPPSVCTIFTPIKLYPNSPKPMLVPIRLQLGTLGRLRCNLKNVLTVAVWKWRALPRAHFDGSIWFLALYITC